MFAADQKQIKHIHDVILISAEMNSIPFVLWWEDLRHCLVFIIIIIIIIEFVVSLLQCVNKTKISK